jgi:hypothetical protein
MSIDSIAIRAAALTVVAAPAIALAQSERPVSVELQALNPPVPDELVLAEERRVPAEQKAAAYIDPEWTPPRTSWGHPTSKAPTRPTICVQFLSTAPKRSARRNS